MKKSLLYIALFLIAACLPVRGNENEVRWLWMDHIWVPIIFLFLSLICIGIYLYRLERLNSKM
jgi:uncharacterized membrane protein YhdT